MQNRYPTKVTHINSFEQDSARRDFTINSLGINSKGEIIDYQNGLDDIKKGVIRAVGKPMERFTEDALRILRLFRFASRYGFDIEDDTKQAAKDLGHLIDNLSVERISDELNKISSSGDHLANYIEHLDDSGLLERILPEVKALQGKKQNPKHHPEGDSYRHSIQALRASRSNNPVTNIAILLHDIGKGTVETGEKDGHPTYNAHDKAGVELVREIGKRLKFPSELIKAVEFVAGRHMVAHYISDMSKKKITQLVNNPYWEILKDAVYADEMSRGDIGKGGVEEFEAKIKYAEDIASELSKGEGEQGVKDRLKEKIDGNKVMKWTGLQPGRELGTILSMTHDWLYGNIDATDKQVKDYVMAAYAQLKSKEPISLEECYEVMVNGQKTI